jgi:starch-binding outer membrane protein, SusD/RagB family
MNQKTIFSACILAISLMACKREFLEVKPLVGASEANFFLNAADAEASIIACYNPLQQEVSPIQGFGQLAPHFRWYFGDIVSDDSFKGGSGDGDEPELLLFENFQGNSGSKLILGEWQAAYRGIAYCNLSLDRIPDIDMDIADKVRFLGEASFIRAFWYFNLVTMFGDVPLITANLAPSEYQQERSPASAVWAQIEADLETARQGLPYRSSISVSEIGRATRGAATSLLAKAHAYQGEWQSCYDMASEVVSSGEYSLAPNYENIFTELGENGPGSIWEIQYMNASGGNWGNQLEGTFTNVFTRARGQFGGYGFNIPEQNFVDEFEANDPRLTATVFQEGDIMGDRGEFSLDATGMPHLYYTKKYFINASDEAPFGDPNPNGYSNDRVIRYADVILFKAEAAYHLGLEDEAKAAVRSIRDRARGGAEQQFPGVLPNIVVNTATGQDLLEAIYHERRVELGLEGHRFFDIVRQGRATTLLTEQGFLSGIHEIYPIPEAEITLSGGLITQNNGY